MEYVGEVIDSDEFETRAMEYARGKIPHFYFMSLKSDCIIDATVKGNISRFINHSCEPNAETQKVPYSQYDYYVCKYIRRMNSQF